MPTSHEPRGMAPELLCHLIVGCLSVWKWRPRKQTPCPLLPLIFIVIFLTTGFVRAVPEQKPFLTDEDFKNADDKVWEEDGTALTADDFNYARKLTDYELYPSDGPNRVKLYAQGNYRGDIRGKAAWSLASGGSGVRRNGVVHQRKMWSSGRIPYVISAQYNQRERAVLAKAIDEYHRRTCVRFEPRTAFDRDYLYIGKIDGCFSDVGKAGGRQELSLDNGCLEYDTVIHELMHGVGFYHEHERWDRDKYIDILWQNIDREAYDQFGRVDLSDSSYYRQPYDYYSIMHYDARAFSKNGFETMVARRHDMTKVIGNAVDFSQVDLSKINTMYNCNGRTSLNSPSPAVQQTGHPNWPNSPQQPLNNINSGFNLNDNNGHPNFNSNIGNTNNNNQNSNDGSCQDRTQLCWRWLDRCRSYFFEKIMREFCAKSCGYCNSGTVAQQNTNNQQYGNYRTFGR